MLSTDLSMSRAENSHIREAARSFKRFCERQNDLYARMTELAKQNIMDPCTSDAERDETRQSLHEIEVDQAVFARRVSQCTLAKYVGEENRDGRPDGRESRIGISDGLGAVDFPRVARSDARATMISGYAAVWNSETEISGLFRETIASGAFRQALSDKSRDIRLLFNHSPDHIVGRDGHGLHVVEDSIGLAFWSPLLDNDPLSEALAVRIRLGIISGCSFSFTVDPRDGDTWELPSDGGLPLRTLKNIDTLWDVSPVTYPAYKNTSVQIQESARSAESKADAYDFDTWAADADELFHRQQQYETAGERIKRMRSSISGADLRQIIAKLRETRPAIQTS